MSIHSVKGEIPHLDVRSERIAAGTVAGDHVTPGSLGGSTLTSVVSPFDPRLSYSGSWTAHVGLDAMDFLGENLQGTTPGSTVNLNFSGTNVSVIGRTAPFGGRADVYVDGVLQGGRTNTFTFLSASYNLGGLNATDTSIAVNSTSAFNSSGYVQIGSEVISYSSTDSTHFLGCTRGVAGTKASTHMTGSSVYSYSSVIEGYSPDQQPRITMWSNNMLPPGNHTLSLVVRSDSNPASSATTLYLNCFVVGGAIGAGNIVTHLDYETYPGVSINSFGYSTLGFTLTTSTTDQQVLGVVGAMAYDGSGNPAWCGVSVDPTTGALGFYVPSLTSQTVKVVVTVSVLGAPL